MDIVMNKVRLGFLILGLGALIFFMLVRLPASIAAQSEAAFGDHILKGTYGFTLEGVSYVTPPSASEEGERSGPTHICLLGQIVADGQGQITQGVRTANLDGDVFQDTVNGTYTVNTDGTGSLTLNAFMGEDQVAVEEFACYFTQTGDQFECMVTSVTLSGEEPLPEVSWVALATGLQQSTDTPLSPTDTPTLDAARSQTLEWLVYDTENSELPQNHVIALASDTLGDLWMGTLWGGLAKFDGETWTVYNTDNSGLPSDQVSALAFDAQGTLWVGTDDGLAKFDGETWTVFTTDNSDLPYDSILQLVFDTQGNLWIGTGQFYADGGGGLAKFDGETWVIHTKDNFELQDDQIFALAVDPQGNLWAGTNGVVKFDGETWTAYTADNTELRWGVVPALAFDAQGNLWVANRGYGVEKFDGANWTEYNPRNSELPYVGFRGNNVFDGQENLWIATDRGLVKFDGQSWTVFNEDNSGLPDNNIWIITIDAHGNKWIGTDRGLAAYREGGVILSDKGAELRQSTDIPGPSVATAADLIGTWEVQSIDPLVIEYNEDGTYRAAGNVASLDFYPYHVGNFRLEGPLLTFDTGDGPGFFCRNQSGTYQIELTAEGQYKLELQEDQCEVRAEYFVIPWSRISP